MSDTDNARITELQNRNAVGARVMTDPANIPGAVQAQNDKALATLACSYRMSASPPKADIAGRQWNVRFVPKADIKRNTVLECDGRSSRMTAGFLSIKGEDHVSAEHRLLGRDHI
jgi:hypothetical protein